MTPRDQKMALLLIGIMALTVGATGGYFFVFDPVMKNRAAESALMGEITKLEEDARKQAVKLKQLNVQRAQSLPADPTRPGDTTLLLGLDRDGSNHLTVLNANWSINPKERLALDFTLTGGSYPKHFAVGLASDDQQGFVTSFEKPFPTYLARSQTLNIARGDVPVERLSLAGSGAAIAALRDCVTARKAPPTKATRSGDAADGIPRDPFAKAASRKR